MATTINVISVNFINSNGISVPKYEVPVKLLLEYDPDGLSVRIKRGKVNNLTFFHYNLPRLDPRG